MALISIYIRDIRVKALFITNTGGGDGNEGGYPIGGGGDGNSGENPNPLLGSEDPICGGCTPTVPVLPDFNDEIDEPEPDCDTSKEDLKKLFPDADDDIMQTLADAINDHAADFGIDTKAELQQFLAQATIETGDFDELNVTENLNYSTASYLPINYSAFTMDAAEANTNGDKYYAPDYLHNSEGVANVSMANRLCNGSVSSGDGWKYRGRGIMQLTGKCNYRDFQNWYNDEYDSDKDFLNDPDMISNDDTLAILSGMWYFQEYVLDHMHIDSDTSADDVTKKINRKTKSYKERRDKLTEAEDEIECI